MEKTLTKICEYLNNYFARNKEQGSFTIANGAIVNMPASLKLKEGQYFRILGSDLNDGVYVYPVTGLKDETFDGALWSMAVPVTVIDLVADIDEWLSLYGGADSPANSPFNSESFGNYSYSKGSSVTGSSSVNTWQSAFGARLAPYRRLRGMQ